MDSTPLSGEGGHGSGEPVPIETLEYEPDAALRRAEALREELEMALVADEPVGPILDELFDLIRLARR